MDTFYSHIRGRKNQCLSKSSSDREINALACLTNTNLNNFHLFVVLITGMYLILIWFLFFFRMSITENAVSVFSVVYHLLLSILVNIGLIVSTTKWAGKNRFLSLLLLIPAFIGSSLIALGHHFVLGLLVLCVILLSGWIIWTKRRCVETS
jgi:membrane-associated HD superfamily phosphohydrolase